MRQIIRVHDTKAIEEMLERCDTSIIYYVDLTYTKLNIPSLCHLILPNVPSNLLNVYEKNMFKLLKSCAAFNEMGLIDGILAIIAEYMSVNGDGEFKLEYESKPRSIYNANYYCDIKKIVLSENYLSIDIEEHGDMSWGHLQPPTSSILRSQKANKIENVKYISFSQYDMKYKVYGVMVYQVNNLYKLSIDEILDFKFKYGTGGYQWVHLFNSSNETHTEFIQNYLEYYNFKYNST